MQKSVQARKNRIISTMNGQFQSGLPIFKTNRNTNRDLKGDTIMGLFSKNKKENKKQEEKQEIDAPGWDAIDEEAKRIYPGQDNPKHYAALVKWKFGGPDPLDGISVFDGGDYWHFVTYGLSELYEKESEDKEWSGYGMEFTFKLKKDNRVDEEQEIKCICGLLQQIARITFENDEIFDTFEYLYTGQTAGVDSRKISNITGFITIPDTQFQTLNTKNGRVDFVEFVGATNNELLALKNKELDVKTLYSKIGSDVTDYKRESVM